jgi:hypothetical protein
MIMNRLPLKIFMLSLMAVFFSGCGGGLKNAPDIITPISESYTPRMGYAIQAGAFSSLDNAVRFTDTLKGLGLDAYYFLHESGLYKVRFGNYTSRELALANAKELKAKGYISDYYIVTPEDYPWGKAGERSDPETIRRGIIKAAKSYLHIPYRYGRTTAEQGLDSSRLAMPVYRLNGINLPAQAESSTGQGGLWIRMI